MKNKSEIELDTNAPAVAASIHGDPSDGLAQRVFAARVRLLYSGIGLTASSNLICAAVIAVIHRNLVEGVVVLGWLAFMATSIVLRVWLVGRFKTVAPVDSAMRDWARRYLLGALWTGVGWGIAGMIFLPVAPPPHQIVTTAVLGGLAAAAATTLTRHYPVYLAFTVPTFLPVPIHFALMGGKPDTAWPS